MTFNVTRLSESKTTVLRPGGPGGPGPQQADASKGGVTGGSHATPAAAWLSARAGFSGDITVLNTFLLPGSRHDEEDVHTLDEPVGTWTQRRTEQAVF